MKFKADGTAVPDIYDNFTKAKNEVKELQARLILARDLIAVLSHNGMMPENMMVDKGDAWRKWRDKDTQP